MLDVGDRAVADHQLRLARQDRCNQARDIIRVILVVGIGVDDDVGAFLHRTLQPGDEGMGQAHVDRQIDDMIDTAGAGDLHGAVAAAVVDHEPFDPIDPGQPARQMRQRRGQRFFFVEARYLDDQLHALRSGNSGLPWHSTRKLD